LVVWQRKKSKPRKAPHDEPRYTFIYLFSSYRLCFSVVAIRLEKKN
jgi:hypothetical protein